MPHPGQTPSQSQSPRASDSHLVHNRVRDSKEHLLLNNRKMMEKLDSKQREAVEFGEGPLLVVAGAGTGKTRVITNRVAFLIAKKKAKPEEIVALTFTEKAASDMEARVDVLVPYGYTDAWISTFHAFGDAMVRENSLDAGISPDVKVLTGPEQVLFIREHLFEFDLHYYRPLANPTRFIQALTSLFSRAKDEEITPERYVQFAQSLKEKSEKNPELEELVEEAKKQIEIANAYAKYEELKAKHGYIDFGDQVTLALRLLREHPSILKRYREKFRYILVDEFQDTNYAQFELVKLIASPRNNITVVGDDDQSIYKFRGACLSNILGFVETYPDAKQVVITRNYRSRQRILDAAYRLIGHNNPGRLEVKNGIDKKLTGRKGNGSCINHLFYDTLSSEADGVANAIQTEVSAGNRAYRDFAILVRSNADADPFLRSLNMRGVPWTFSGNEGLYQREEIRLLISFLRVVADPDDSTSLFYLAASTIYAIDPVVLSRLSATARKRNRSLFSILQQIDQAAMNEEISESTKKQISSMVDNIRGYIKDSVAKVTGQLLYEFITESGYLDRLVQSPSKESSEEVQNVAKFFDIVKSYGRMIKHDRASEFVERLDLLMESGDSPAVAEANPDEDAVSVMTVHKAKGLEFPVVFMVSLVSDRFPLKRKRQTIELPQQLVKEAVPKGEQHILEQRRLFYVGMTRAKDELNLTGGSDYGGVRPRKVSRFVLEALDMRPGQEVKYRASPIEAIRRNAPKVKAEADEYRPIPDETILNVSHFQIDDYITCPLKYRYVHIMRVPIMTHHAVVYGRALHRAVAEYHKAKVNHNDFSIEDLLAVFEGAWVSEGFLTREHEDRRLEAGKEVLRAFFKEEEESGVSPAHVEKPFSFMMGNDRVTGRWDRVDVTGDEVSIVDYKSSEVKSQKDADKKAADSLQLSIYALGYEKAFGKRPERVELRFLGSRLHGSAEVTEKMLARAEEKIAEAAKGIRKCVFEATPGYMACTYCAYRQICSKSDR